MRSVLAQSRIIEGLPLEPIIILSAAAFTLLCAYAVGRILAAAAGASLPRPIVFLAGAALLSQAVLALGLMSLAKPAAFLMLGVAALAGGALVRTPPAPVAVTPAPEPVAVHPPGGAN